MNITEVLKGLVMDSGFSAITWQQVVMILVACALLYLAIVKKFEPMLLLTIAFGMLLVNLPLGGLMSPPPEGESWTKAGLLYPFSQGVKSSIFPCLIFIGVGAMTDFGPMLANPMSLLLGAAAQLGIYVAFVLAIVMGHTIPGIDFTPQQAAAIAIIGGADGPTAIFLSSKLSPNLMGAIAVCAYSYMALVPVIQPPLMRLLTTKKERLIRMKPARQVSQTERILFPIIGLLLTTFIVPSGLPLLGMLFFGNLLKESGKTTRLAKTAGSALNDIVVMLLGLTVGCSTQASEFLTVKTIYIFFLGAMAFIIATASGVLFVKFMNVFLPKSKKINPLIGNAGVSAVPMSARISNNIGLEYDRHNFLLMHAMGPNVAGVIGSAVAAGALLGFMS